MILKNDHLCSFFNIIYTCLGSIFEPYYIQNCVITSRVIKRLQCIKLFCEWSTQALIRLHKCADWYRPILCAYAISNNHFSQHITLEFGHNTLYFLQFYMLAQQRFTSACTSAQADQSSLSA